VLFLQLLEKILIERLNIERLLLGLF